MNENEIKSALSESGVPEQPSPTPERASVAEPTPSVDVAPIPQAMPASAPTSRPASNQPPSVADYTSNQPTPSPVGSIGNKPVYPPSYSRPIGGPAPSAPPRTASAGNPPNGTTPPAGAIPSMGMPLPFVAPVKQPKKNRLPLILCLTAIILIVSTVAGIVGGAIAAGIADGIGSSGQLNSSVVTQTVVNVNNGEISETALMQAAAQAVNSVVVIDTFLSQEAVEAGEASGAGSGVIWTADGYIVTCNHVIDGFTIIRVTLADGSSYFADIVGTDLKTDLAVLKIKANGKFLPVTVRGTDLILAETVIAIGNPLGVLSNTVSSGILSCLTREIRIEGQTMSLLQIDAAVNHGNSGGGLFDANGSLIGIVNAKSTGDSVEGIGFAIPINTVMDVSKQLIEQGYVTGRPQLGIEVVTVSQTNSSYVFSEEYFPDLKPYATTTYKDAWGRERTQIIPGVYINNASAVAGYGEGSEQLAFGDRILYVGGTEITTSNDVLSALSEYNAGDTLQMTVQRNHSNTIVITVILGQKGA